MFDVFGYWTALTILLLGPFYLALAFLMNFLDHQWRKANNISRPSLSYGWKPNQLVMKPLVDKDEDIKTLPMVYMIVTTFIFGVISILCLAKNIPYIEVYHALAMLLKTTVAYVTLTLFAILSFVKGSYYFFLIQSKMGKIKEL